MQKNHKMPKLVLLSVPALLIIWALDFHSAQPEAAAAMRGDGSRHGRFDNRG